MVNLYIWFIISSCYSSDPLTLALIETNDGLRTLRHIAGLLVSRG